MSQRLPSPIDRMNAPDRLAARVVTPGGRPRLHGYDVQEDLSLHYSFGEVVFTALVGEAPSAHAGRAFDALLVFAAPISIAEAPSHAAALARLCAARPSNVASVAAIGLTEQSRHRLEELAPVLAWLERGRAGEAPLGGAAEDTARLHACLSACGIEASPADLALPLPAAIVAALFDLGLREAWQIEAVFAVARWPVAIAEAMSNRPGALGSYPIRLPEFELTREGV